jgi:hypothetical protein
VVCVRQRGGRIRRGGGMTQISPKRENFLKLGFQMEIVRSAKKKNLVSWNYYTPQICLYVHNVTQAFDSSCPIS